jgi:hypothetical protein
MEKYLIFGVIVFFVGGFIGFIIGTQVGLKMGLRVKAEPPSPVPGILCILGSMFLIVASIVSSIYSLYFINNSVQTKATVTEIREQKDDEGNISRYPAYEYFDSSGQQFSDTTSMSDGRKYGVGDKIPIRYLKKIPQESRIDHFSHHWLLSIIFGIAGVALAAVGAGLYWNYKRKIQLPLANPAVQGTARAGRL